jgi:hypothetical protein
VFRGLLWVARAVRECAAAIPRLTERVGDVERRVGALAERPAPPAPLGDGLGRDAAARLDGVEARLARLDGLVKAPAPGPSVDAQVRDLRRDLGAADRRLAAMELRLAPVESLPARVEELVVRHVDRLAAETLSLPADVEGVYRELDAVAEVMAARHEAVARGLERIATLEAALGELRERVSRFVDELEDDAPAGPRPQRQPERQPQPATVAVDAGPLPARQPDADSPDGARRVLEVLTGELERIRQSIDVLVLDRGPASHGGGPRG